MDKNEIKKEGWRKFAKTHILKRRDQTIKYNNRLRHAVVDMLGSKCCQCGFRDYRALQIDHINGGGLKDKKLGKGFYIKRVLDEILAGSGKYQLLCANCNWIKKSVNNETVKKKDL